MKKNLTTILSASLAAVLLTPTATLAQNKLKEMSEAAQTLYKAESTLTKSAAELSNLSKKIEKAVRNSEAMTKKIYKVDVERATLPAIHFEEGRNHGVFQCITNENIKVVDTGAVKVKTVTTDGLVPLAGQDKAFTVCAGDKILISPTFRFPMIMNAEKFKKLYAPLEGQRNVFTLRSQPAEPSPIDVRLFTRDWQPTPTPGYNNPPMYKKGDVLVSLYDGNLRLVMPREEFLTFFHADGDFAEVAAKLFKKWGVKDTLKFLGIQAGEPAFYVEKSVRAKQTLWGDWLVTQANKEQAVFSSETFARDYTPDLELGEGWYKPAGAPQQFIEIKRDLTIKTSWGETQFLRSGDRLNITNPERIYGVAKAEFEETYKPVEGQETTSETSGNSEAVQNNKPGRPEINAWTSLKAFMEVANQHRPYEPWDFVKESYIPDL